MSQNRPILNPQVSHTSELADVARHHGQIVNQRDGGNLHVERANDISRPLKLIADAAIDIGGAVIEWKGIEFPEQYLNFRNSLRWVFILPCTVDKLGADRSAASDFRRRGKRNAIGNQTIRCSRFVCPQDLNPDVTIEQIAFHHVLAGGSGNSGAISNSTSARHPMRSAKSGRSLFISSKDGISASAIIRLTRSSTSFALSASSRLSSSVSCFGILLMPASCHAPRPASTSLLL